MPRRQRLFWSARNVALLLAALAVGFAALKHVEWASARDIKISESTQLPSEGWVVNAAVMPDRARAVPALEGQVDEAVERDAESVCSDEGARLDVLVLLDDGRPAASSTLRLWRSSEDAAAVYEANTDTDGQACFLGRLPGEYTVSIDHSSIGCPFAISAGLWEKENGLTVRLPGRTTVSGRVVDGNSGQPLVGVEVRARATAPRCVRTDAVGVFHYPWFDEGGTRTLHLKRRGYVSTVTEVDPSSGMPLVMRTGATFVGRVLDDRGAPLEGVRVSAVSSLGRQRDVNEETVTTDREGRFSVPDRGATPHLLCIRAPGWGTRVVAISPDPSTETVTIGAVRLQVATSLAGTVQAENGDPVAGVTIALAPTDQASLADHRRLSSLVTQIGSADSTGTFRFDDLEPGSYRVTLRRANAVDDVTVLEVGRDPKEHCFQLSTSPSLTVRVADEDGRPLPGVTVRARGAVVSVRGKSDRFGFLQLVGLTDGPLRVSVVAPPGRLSVDRVVEALPYELRVALPRRGEICGRVFDGDREPIGGLVVEAQSAAGNARGRTDRRGMFALEVPDVGVYDLRAYGELDGRSLESRELTCGPNEAELELFALPSDRRVTVRVLGPDGVLVAGALAWSEGPGERVQTNSSGSAVFSAKPGIQRWVAIPPAGREGWTASVPNASDASFVELTLRAAVSMSVTLSGPMGSAVANVRLIARDESGYVDSGLSDVDGYVALSVPDRATIELTATWTREDGAVQTQTMVTHSSRSPVAFQLAHGPHADG